MRIIKELLKPILKCERVGHLTKTRGWEGYAKPEDRYYVIDHVKGHVDFCPRCGHEHARRIDHRKGYTGWTCPSYMSDQVREKGYCEL